MPGALQKQVCDHARRGAREEICGFLTGVEDEVRRVYPWRRTRSPRNREPLSGR